jgi:hypothetical protein
MPAPERGEVWLVDLRAGRIPVADDRKRDASTGAEREDRIRRTGAVRISQEERSA